MHHTAGKQRKGRQGDKGTRGQGKTLCSFIPPLLVSPSPCLPFPIPFWSLTVIEFARNLLNFGIHTQTRRNDVEADDLRRDSCRFRRDRRVGRERTDRE